MLDSIFGEENFIATIARQQKSGGAKAKFFTPNLDYIHVYAKNIESAEPFRARLNEFKSKIITNILSKAGAMTVEFTVKNDFTKRVWKSVLTSGIG